MDLCKGTDGRNCVFTTCTEWLSTASLQKMVNESWFNVRTY